MVGPHVADESAPINLSVRLQCRSIGEILDRRAGRNGQPLAEIAGMPQDAVPVRASNHKDANQPAGDRQGLRVKTTGDVVAHATAEVA